MKKAAALPLFGDAYLADTRHLSLEEHGAYLQLLLIAWRSPECALADDDAIMARMLGVTPKKWAKLKPQVMAFWTLEKGSWTQKRLTKERRFVAKKSEQNAQSANARWSAKPLENNGWEDANAMRTQCGNDAPPPPPTKEEKETVGRKRPGYAFFGKTIKLKPHDLDRWRRTYHSIADIDAELASLDAWFDGQPEKRKNWFYITASSLNKRHQENIANRRDYDRDRITV